MIEYKINHQLTDKQLRPLYESVEWLAYTDKFVDLSLLIKDCSLVISAFDQDKLVGLIRVISDNVSIAYIQDILVYPDYQKQGIGHTLLKQVLDHTKHIRQTLLITDGSDNKANQFYKNNGFVSLEDYKLKGYYLDR